MKEYLKDKADWINFALVSLGFVFLYVLLNVVFVLFTKDIVFEDEIIEYFLAELTLLVAVFFSTTKMHKNYVFKWNAKDCLEGIKAGMLMFVITILASIGVFQTIDLSQLKPWYSIAIFVIYMVTIGIAEEGLCRGIVFTTFLEQFGTTKKGVWISVLLSGALFGSLHLANVFAGTSFKGALIQAIVASAMGCYFSAMYWRGNNLWSCIILHALMDFEGLLVEGLVGEGTIVSTISDYEYTQALGFVFYMGLTLFMLRDKKANFKENPKQDDSLE